ncbi:MAG: class I SAM-dependent methyltransferase [Candidatus Limnocylindria bacterium]
MRREQPPWSYEALARAAMRGARAALDLGTGGGEVLASLADSFPPLMIATEAYPPNLDVAARRLGALRARVIAYGLDADRPAPSAVQDGAAAVPLRDGVFDLVLDRHEAYDAREVARILAPDGVFLTQQSDGRSYEDLLQRFGASPQWPGVTLDNLVPELVDAGLVIQSASQWWGGVAFSDVGAVVYYLKAIPWLVPGFSVAHFEPVLLELQQELEQAGELRFSEGLFLIRARKSG